MENTKKILKTVQIGIGHDHATSAFNSILKQPETFEVVGFAVPECEEEKYADRISEYRDQRGVPYYSVSELLALPDIDCAVIETEEENLAKYACMAAERGIHIHMDKPGGYKLDEFERLIEIVRAKKLAFSTGYMYRFNPKIRECFKKIENGELGEVFCVEAHMDVAYSVQKRQWLVDMGFPGGMMFFLGCHLIDLIYRLQGEPDEVIPLNCATGYYDIPAVDYGMVAFKYPHGVSFAKTCSMECGGFRRRQLVICGTKGTFELKPLEVLTDVRDMLYTEMHENYHVDGGLAPGRHSVSEYFNRFDDMLYHFAMVARGEIENEYTYDYELGLYKLILRSCGISD